MVTSRDIEYLDQCVALAREALDAGDDPFGSLLVNPSTGTIHARDRNRTRTGSSPLLPNSPPGADATLHPEFTIARWACLNLSPEERAACTVYTSGEHCAMCSAAHAYAGIGKIVFSTSSVQLGETLTELGLRGTGPVKPLPAGEVAPLTEVEGPVNEVAVKVIELYKEWKGKK